MISIAPLCAQDIHFSQPYASPVNFNPAYTGFFNGNWRFSNNYRTQWSAIGEPYNTISMGFDKPFKMPKSDMGLGVLFVNDRSGSSHLNINKMYLAFNHIRTINEIHQLGFALQAGYIVKSFDLGNITLPSQFNSVSGEFDASMPNNLDQWAENIYYGDINFGAIYNGDFGKYSPTGGISLFHLNMPKYSFLREDNNMPMRIVMHGSVAIDLHDSYYTETYLIYMHQKMAGNMFLGGNLYLKMPEGNLLQQMHAGIFTRTSFNNIDAMIFSMGMDLYDFRIGFSYDVNISPLINATNMRGAFEITLTYTDISKTLHKIALPCDRF